MSLLSVRDLHLGFHGRPLFQGDSLTISHKERVGIVGPNGSGKTTLLRLLVGQTEPEKGEVVRARRLRIGYLPQELGVGSEEQLLDSVLACAPHRARIEERIEAVQADLDQAADSDAQMELSQELFNLHDELARIDRDFAPHHARRILLGLGFSTAEFEAPLSSFSGGWRMRAALAGLLFQKPEVLLLDEPTNHLDMPSVHWLNRFLDQFPSALVLICHDREFLNRHVNRIVSFETEGLRSYQGDYESYRKQRRQELTTLEARAKKDEQRKKELEAFITRFKAKNTKARQAQSKAKLIEKMQKEMVELPQLHRTIRLQFRPTSRSGDPVLEIEGLRHAYGDKVVLDHVDLSVRRGDRIAIVGLNGAGKTTLLKLVAGELALTVGQIRAPRNVEPSYFAQHHTEVLDGSQTILDEVWKAAPELSQSEVRGVCGAFLFGGDEVEKTVRVLSGGEKTRVALARILVHPGNLLLLDEPTNHLDTESAERLTDSLLTYDGTVLFVSHNLDFARRLSNKVWDVRDGSVFEYPGSLADYLEHLTREQSVLDADEGENASRSASSAGADPSAANKQARVRARKEETARRRAHEKLLRQVAALEKEIAELEQAQQKLEADLADPRVYEDRIRAAELAERFRETRGRLERRMASWEEFQVRLEQSQGS